MLDEYDYLFEGINVHYWEGGSGFPILLLHGSGPGASTIGNWRKVLEPLATRYHIYAMDLIGFGKSGRKASPPYFDIPLWQRQCAHFVHTIAQKPLGLLAHSLSGALALTLAANAQTLIKCIVTTGCMGMEYKANEATKRIWSFPKDRDDLVDTARVLIQDSRLIDNDYLDNRARILWSGDYEAYFSEMFKGDKQQYIDQSVISEEVLSSVQCKTAMVHGRDDKGFPAAALTLRLADALPEADIYLFGRCSHSIAFEYPNKLLSVVDSLVSEVQHVKPVSS